MFTVHELALVEDDHYEKKFTNNGELSVFFGTFGYGQIFQGCAVRIAAPSLIHARNMMFTVFDRKFCTVYEESDFKAYEYKDNGCMLTPIIMDFKCTIINEHKPMVIDCTKTHNNELGMRS